MYLVPEFRLIGKRLKIVHQLYFPVLDANPLAGGERVLTNTNDALTDFDDICDTSYSYDEAEYSILIKKGTRVLNVCSDGLYI